MGVLGDDDIEKIEQTYQKRRLGKIWFEPKKAHNAFYCVLVGAIVMFYVAFIFGMAYFGALETTNNTTILSDEFKDIVISNSDCDTLKRIYAGLHNSDLGWLNTEQLIKDEIYYRC